MPEFQNKQWANTNAEIARDVYVTPYTIFSGFSVGSGPIDMGGHAMMGIAVPSGAAGTQFSFRAAVPNVGLDGTFMDVYDDGGNQVLVNYGTNRVVGIDLASGPLAPLRLLQLRTGPTASANNQTANMTFYVMTKV